VKTQSAYCSACDKDVRIVIAEAQSADGQSRMNDSEIVCLEIGAHCTGSLCPVGATSPAVMAARLIRTGLYTSVHPIIKMHCDGCGMESEFVTVDTQYASCTVCGTTIEWNDSIP
jgi:hypothetical protein